MEEKDRTNDEESPVREGKDFEDRENERGTEDSRKTSTDQEGQGWDDDCDSPSDWLPDIDESFESGFRG